MTQSPNAVETERRLIQQLADRKTPRAEFLAAVRAIPADRRFVLPQEWIPLVQDRALDDWRRLAAYELLISRAISYPARWSAFAGVALQPLEIAPDDLVDMSMAQAVPVRRSQDSTIRMARLPFSTATGNAALYVNVRGDTVQEAATFPSIVAG